MPRIVPALIYALMLAPPLCAETSPAASALTALLNEFLAGASRNDALVHDRFWAEDLIYTSASGRRIGKADILGGLRSPSAPRPAGPTPTYAAEDVRIQPYGDMAVVAFRLLATTRKDGQVQVARYLNTGLFRAREGRWQAVAWQATRLPLPEDEAKKDVAAAEAALHQAVLAADVAALESLIGGGFIWTHGAGEQMTRPQLLDDLASGTLKYSKLDRSRVTVAVHGDTAVVRGESQRQRSSFRGSAGAGDPAPYPVFYTVTFANQGEGWKAVAMHSSRPPGR
jgi:ketosteroid isomerase-like protein